MSSRSKFRNQGTHDPFHPRLRFEGTRRVWPFLGMIEVRAVKAPDPEIFKLALERAGCALSEAVMIGDRLDNDIRPARLRGWKTIRVAQGFAAGLALF